MLSLFLTALIPLLQIPGGSLPPASGCQPEWIPSFGRQPGLGNTVFAMVPFDAGSGEALYAGGIFTDAGGVPANRIAKWDGQGWSNLGTGLDNNVLTLVVHDDGSGPALFVGGLFTLAGGLPANRIAKWDGSTWSALGSGFDEQVRDLAVFDDGSGSGPLLYAGGDFNTAGGAPAAKLARWDGSTWTAVGGGVNNTVNVLRVHQSPSDGSPALYVGGRFTSAGGVAANRIARWNGSTWTPLGSGVGSGGFFNVGVRTLEVFDDGSGAGPVLFAAGDFFSAGGLPAANIARWNGSAWSPLGAGLSGGAFGATDLEVFNDGSGAGAALYAVGDFTSAGGVAASRIARWNGAAWSALGSGVEANAFSLLVHDDGSGAGEQLLVGGAYFFADGLWSPRLARWDSSGWSAFTGGVASSVSDMLVHDDGSGPALYVGDPSAVDGTPYKRITRWNGQAWSDVGGGMNNRIMDMCEFDLGSGAGTELIAGGIFTQAGGTAALRIASWSGSNWAPIGAGFNAGVNALTSFDDGSGSGPALVAAGSFSASGSTAAALIAQWDGNAWNPLGLGIGPSFREVEALAVYDDGSGLGPALYAAGDFTTAGGNPISFIAKWDGVTWSAVGAGTDGPVYVLQVFDDGSGPALYAGGAFTSAGGIPANSVARWNGSGWSALGAGVEGVPVPGFQVLGAATSMAVHDDGSGAALFVGGSFTTAGGQPAASLAKWNGSSWSPLGPGTGPTVSALTSFDDGSGVGPVLFAGGSFIAPFGDDLLARWGCPAPSGFNGYPGCFGNNPSLSANTQSLHLGGTTTFTLTSGSSGPAVDALYIGLLGVDGSGCGLLLPGIGELLLSLNPFPLELANSLAAGPATSFPITVPNAPQLVGKTVALQGVHIDINGGSPTIQLSGALAATIHL